MNINLYSLPFFAAFLINLLVGCFVISQNHRHRTNIVFSFLPLIFVVWNLCYIVIFNSNSFELSMLCAKIVWTMVAFLGAIYLHLALIFPKERKLSRHALTYVVIYTPSVFFTYITWFTPLMVAGPQSTAYASHFYRYGAATAAYSIYLELMFLLVIFLFVSIMRKAPRKRERLQSKWMLIATLIPIVGGSITNLFLPIMGFYVYPLAPVLTAVMATLIAYAILKYKLISVTPASAAEVIISMLPGIFILLDTEQRILHTNKRLLEMLEYEKDELTGQSINMILAKEEQLQGLPWKRWEEKNYYQNFHIHFESKSGKKILISFSGTIIEDESNDIAGLVGIGFPVSA